MGTKVGLWIDNRKAIVVTVTDKGEEMELIVSTVQKQLRRSGDSPLKGPYEQQQVPADASRQRTLTGHLNIYYDAVIACIGDAESILIFGPGEAKGELKKRLKRKTLGRRIAGFFFQAEDGIRDYKVTGVQTCALPISIGHVPRAAMRSLEDRMQAVEQRVRGAADAGRARTAPENPMVTSMRAAVEKAEDQQIGRASL